MHEMSIAAGLIDQVLAAAAEHGLARVERVEVQAGQMRQVVPEALQMAWEAVSAGTVADGAELALTEVPAELRCRGCGREFRRRREEFLCPDCGRADVEILAGDEILLTSISAEKRE
jgi:hydrogenase nickel incorporation protein HypA/HybF